MFPYHLIFALAKRAQDDGYHCPLTVTRPSRPEGVPVPVEGDVLKIFVELFVVPASLILALA